MKMTIEEAIETLKNAFKCNKKQFEELGTHILLQDDEQEAIETLLTAYEKEKEKNKELTDEYLVQRDLINPDFLKDYIHKDKIKAKIEEYKELSNNVTMQPQIYSYIVDVLQSLLEKE